MDNTETTVPKPQTTPEQEQVLAEAGLVLAEPVDPARPHLRHAVDARGRQVVVRLVPLGPGAEGKETLRRLTALRGLRHPGLARVLAVHHLPGSQAAVVAQYVEGVDLGVLLSARGRLRRCEAASLLQDLGQALAHLHEQGLAHGDVSAANTVITPQGRAVLIDLVGGQGERGTPDTAAPERLEGEEGGAPADVYALAALMEQVLDARRTAAGRVVLLEDALEAAPSRRPSARDLVERAERLARPERIEHPGPESLVSGVLRSSTRVPTVTRPRGLVRAGLEALRARSDRCGPVRRHCLPGGAGASRGRGHGQVLVAGPGPGQRGRLRWRAHHHGAWAPARLVAGMAVLLVLGAGTYLLDLWPAQTGRAAASAEDLAIPGALDSLGGPASGAQEVGDRAGQGGGDDLVAVVVSLARARDAALEAQDGAALSQTTVPGSAAAQADARLLAGLKGSGEAVSGLRTQVQGVVEVPLEQVATSLPPPPGARVVRARLSQAAYQRRDGSGERTVPAQVAQEVLLVLAPGPWRVAEVVPAP